MTPASDPTTVTAGLVPRMFGGYAAGDDVGRLGEPDYAAASWLARTWLRAVVYALSVTAERIGPPATPSAAGAPLAQSAERLHGKEKVYGSIP